MIRFLREILHHLVAAFIFSIGVLMAIGLLITELFINGFILENLFFSIFSVGLPIVVGAVLFFRAQQRSKRLAEEELQQKIIRLTMKNDPKEISLDDIAAQLNVRPERSRHTMAKMIKEEIFEQHTTEQGNVIYSLVAFTK